jgi:hypothetical protein
MDCAMVILILISVAIVAKSKPVQALHLSQSKSRALVKAKLAPQTFTAIDLANKAHIVKNGHHVASKAYEVTITDGETGKGIAPTTLNACAHLNNLLKAQQLKKADWAMTKEALEAGVPGMEAVAANFMKQQFSSLYRPYAPVVDAGASANAADGGDSLSALVAENTVVADASNLEQM